MIYSMIIVVGETMANHFFEILHVEPNPSGWERLKFQVCAKHMDSVPVLIELRSRVTLGVPLPSCDFVYTQYQPYVYIYIYINKYKYVHYNYHKPNTIVKLLSSTN